LSNNEFLIYLLNFTNYFSFLLNLSLINWFIILLVSVIIFSNWRKTISINRYIDYYFIFFILLLLI
jgi:hypothetical protein